MNLFNHRVHRGIHRVMEEINIVTDNILKYAFKVHTQLGPGLLESSYKECLFYILNKNGIYTEKEKQCP